MGREMGMFQRCDHPSYKFPFPCTYDKSGFNQAVLEEGKKKKTLSGST